MLPQKTASVALCHACRACLSAQGTSTAPPSGFVRAVHVSPAMMTRGLNRERRPASKHAAPPAIEVGGDFAGAAASAPSPMHPSWKSAFVSAAVDRPRQHVVNRPKQHVVTSHGMRSASKLATGHQPGASPVVPWPVSYKSKIQQVLNKLRRPSNSEIGQVQIMGETRQWMCDRLLLDVSDEFSRNDLSLVVENSSTLLQCLRNEPYPGLQKFSVCIVKGLAALGDGVTKSDVENVLIVLRYNEFPCEQLTAALKDALPVFQHLLPDVLNVHLLMDFVRLLGNHLPGYEFAGDERLAVIYDSIASQLRQTKPVADKSQYLTAVHFAEAVRQLLYRHEGMLEAFAGYVDRLLGDFPVHGVAHARHIAYVFAFMRVPAPQVLRVLTAQLEEQADFTPTCFNQHALVQLCWSYVFHGLRPPKRCLTELCNVLDERVAARITYLRDIPPSSDAGHVGKCIQALEQLKANSLDLPVDPMVLTEFVQLLPHLSRDVPGLAICVSLSMQSLRESPMARRVVDTTPHLLANQVAGGKVMLLCCLDQKGAIQPWVTDARSSTCRIALVVVHRDHILSGSAKHSGVMERQFELLRQSGWLVRAMPMRVLDGVERERNQPLSRFCLDTLTDVYSRSQTIMARRRKYRYEEKRQR
eukprot:scpid35904/ scgid13114/ 